jgi:hypothetical protein
MDSQGRTNLDIRLNDIFELNTKSQVAIAEAKQLTKDEPENFNEFETTQNKLKELVKINLESIDMMKKIAMASENPQAFSTLNSTIKTTAELIQMILDNEMRSATILKKLKEGGNAADLLTEEESPKKMRKVSGSSADIQRQIRAMLKENNGAAIIDA